VTLSIPEGYAQIAIEHRGDGDPDPWYVTFGMDLNGSTATPLEAVQAIIDVYGSTIRPELWSGLQVSGAQCALGTSDPEPLRFFANNLGTQAGGLSGTFLPQNCALLVRKNTGVGGRRNQGRFFIPGMVSEGACNNVGQIEAGSLVAYQTAINSFLTTLNDESEGREMVILHNDPPTGLGPTAVTSLTVSNTISTQRRRLR
jgi:hypothetical protein